MSIAKPLCYSETTQTTSEVMIMPITSDFFVQKDTWCRFKASPNLLTKSNICSILFLLFLKKNENSRNILGRIMPLIKGGNSILEDQNATYAREERKSTYFSQS